MPEINRYGADVDAKMLPQTSCRVLVDKTLNFFETNGRGMVGTILDSEVEIARRSRDMDLPADVHGAMTAFYTNVKDDIYQDGIERGLPVFDMNAADAKNGLTSRSSSRGSMPAASNTCGCPTRPKA